MSISGAFSNALSGLNVASRAAELVSTNLANATTEGYAPRELAQSSRGGQPGGGVSVDGITRRVDRALVADMRMADADAGQARSASSFLEAVETLVGPAGEAGGLASRLSAFETTLVSLASRPDSATRLDRAANAATELVRGLNEASQGIQDLRMRAERDITTQVEMLNDDLARVAQLNAGIVASHRNDQGRAGLEDQRQNLIDRIAGVVPVRELPRENGAVALVTEGGAVLLDGRAARLSFNPANAIDAEMTAGNGALSGLQINGVNIPTDAEFGAVTGGTLGAAFRTRDELAPQAQARLDAFAQDLIARFETVSTPPGQPGLFTDAGQPLGAAPRPGLAGRIAVHQGVDPAQGGATWRMRDGLDATAPGTAGDGSRVNAMIGALQSRRAAPAAMSGAAAGTAADLAGELVAGIGAARHRAESEESFAAARQEGVKAQLLEQGVDTDAQMQRLLQIEQAYSANARLLQTLDEMMQTLMRL